MSKGKKAVERLLLVAIALITFAIVIVSNHYESRIQNQKLLFYQLQAIRTSVNLFKAITKRNPTDLKELAVAEYVFPGEDRPRRYIQILDTAADGGDIDPFGNPYLYDPKTGWARSTTKGYEYW